MAGGDRFLLFLNANPREHADVGSTREGPHLHRERRGRKPCADGEIHRGGRRRGARLHELDCAPALAPRRGGVGGGNRADEQPLLGGAAPHEPKASRQRLAARQRISQEIAVRGACDGDNTA